MPFYNYRVRDRAGKILMGRMEAMSGKELRKKLDEQEYFLIEYEEQKSFKGFEALGEQFFTPKVTFRDLAIFCWQLYTMLNAGLTLINAIKILANQISNEYFKNTLCEVGHRIEEGLAFSEALRQFPRVFSRFFVQMVSAGEVGGILDETLRRLAIFYESQEQVQNRIRSALTYPVILIVTCLSAVCFLVSYILPKFTQVFDSMGMVIPPATRILLQLGTLVRDQWLMLILIIVGVVILFRIYIATKEGRYHFDRFQLALPIWGGLLKKAIAARFTQTLAALISGGIPIITALEVVTETIDNSYVAQILKDVTARVGEGKSIAQPLQESEVFPEMVVSMIRAGEETGALDKMLEKVAYFYDREIDQAIQDFTRMLEPALIVGMTVIIGFIGMTIFTPLANLMRSLRV